jgi:hypothetical protein
MEGKMSNSRLSEVRKKTPWYILIIIAGGVLIRILHLFFISFNSPFHLGGLFYEFSRQILINHFRFPSTIPYYSLGGIPFAYPPLPFYLQAAIMGAFTKTSFITVNLLPPLIAAFSLPVFYWMVSQVTEDNFIQAAALLAFALMPSAFVNQIEGAGLAEAFGTLALLTYLGFIFRFAKTPHFLPALWSGISLGLCVLASPGSAYGAVIVSVIFFVKFLIQDINDHSYLHSTWLLFTGLIGLIVSSPYWLTILGHHDLRIFLTTFLSQQSNGSLLGQIRYMITFKPADMITFVSDEGIYGFVFDALVFTGVVWAVLNRHVLYVILLFALWLVPREGSWMVAIPAAILAGMAFVQILWPLFMNAFSNHIINQRPPLAPGVLGLILAIALIASPLLTIHDLLNQAELMFSPAEVNTLQRYQATIPLDAHVLIAGNGALREWAPALLERQVLNCEFGLEWQPDELQKVNLINDAIHANDLATVMMIVKSYSGDSHLWLVGDPDQVAALAKTTGNLYDISIQDHTPELVLAVIDAK